MIGGYASVGGTRSIGGFSTMENPGVNFVCGGFPGFILSKNIFVRVKLGCTLNYFSIGHLESFLQ